MTEKYSKRQGFWDKKWGRKKSRLSIYLHCFDHEKINSIERLKYIFQEILLAWQRKCCRPKMKRYHFFFRSSWVFSGLKIYDKRCMCSRLYCRRDVHINHSDLSISCIFPVSGTLPTTLFYFKHSSQKSQTVVCKGTLIWFATHWICQLDRNVLIKIKFWFNT